jgi:hypothetical protein
MHALGYNIITGTFSAGTKLILISLEQENSEQQTDC